jgi:hypothetical protein
MVRQVTKEGTKLEADVNGPFQHPAIVTVLRDQFFQKSSSPGNVHMACFVSAHETRSEPELPDAMIAFVGTAVGVSFACVALNKLTV